MPGKANTKARARNGNRKSRRNNMSRRPRRPNVGRNANLTLRFAPSMGCHTPLPQVFFTRFTASGSCYTASGAATGDYTWNFKLNSIAKPFQNVTTGLTWNNLTPSTYEMPGVTSLLSTTMYSDYVVYGAMIEVDITPQSVTDSVICTVTPSQSSSSPSSVGAAAGHPFTRQATFASGRTLKQRDFPLFQRFSTWKLLGLPKYLYMNDVSGNFVGGQSSGVPTDPPVTSPWVMNVETGDNAILSQSLELRFRVTYFVRLYGLETALLSSEGPKPPRRDKQAEMRPEVFRSESPKNYRYPRVRYPGPYMTEAEIKSSPESDPRMENCGERDVWGVVHNPQRTTSAFDEQDAVSVLSRNMSKLLEEPVVIKTGEPVIVLRSEDRKELSHCG